MPHGQLQDLLDSSKSLHDLLVRIGLGNNNGNYQTLRRRFGKEEFDFAKLNKNRTELLSGYCRKLRFRNRLSDAELFIENAPSHNRPTLKRRLVEKGVPQTCSLCGNNGHHNGLPLSLELDHINGINNDNRIENLRFLCPNCHAQQTTSHGKRLKDLEKAKRVSEAKKSIVVDGKRKFICVVPHLKARKATWPSKEELHGAVWSKPTSEVAKNYGVSDNAVAKWCKRLGVEKPARGYWAKKAANLLH